MTSSTASVAAGAGIEPGDTVVVSGVDLPALVSAALQRVGEDGAVIVVDGSAERLDELRSHCHDPRVSYLIGDTHVLPLPDASADPVLAIGDVDADEVGRVVRPRGRA